MLIRTFTQHDLAQLTADRRYVPPVLRGVLPASRVEPEELAVEVPAVLPVASGQLGWVRASAQRYEDGSVITRDTAGFDLADVRALRGQLAGGTASTAPTHPRRSAASTPTSPCG